MKNKRMIIKRTFTKGLCAYFCMVSLFTLLIIGTYMIPKSMVSKNIETAIQTINKEGFDKIVGLHIRFFQLDNVTDCLMMNLMAATPEDGHNVVYHAMINEYYLEKDMTDWNTFAHVTQKVLTGDTQDLQINSYARYWHGYQVTLKPMLIFFSYPTIRVLNYILFTLLLGYCCWLLYQRTNKTTVFLFLLSLLLVAFPIVPLSLQYSTCFYIMLISMIVIMRWTALQKSYDKLLCTFLVIGGITSFMDFLTTPQITLGFPLLTYLLSSSSKHKTKLVILASLFWCVGYGAIWVSKWGIGYLFTNHDILSDALQSAKLRCSDMAFDKHMTIKNTLSWFWSQVEKKHLEHLLLATTLGALGVLGIYTRTIKNRFVLKENSYLLLIAIIVPAWYLTLRNHSLIHCWFTWRACALPLFAIFLFIYHTASWKLLFGKYKKDANPKKVTR